MLRKTIVSLVVFIMCLSFATAYQNFCLADVTHYRSDYTFSGQTPINFQPPIRTSWVEIVGASNSCPIVVGEKLYISTTWGLICYNAKWGTKIWQFCDKDFHNSSPCYHDQVVYAGRKNAMYAVEADTGYQKWKYDTGKDSVNSSPVFYQNHIYFASGKMLFCLDAKTGKKVWDIGFGQTINLPVAFGKERFFVAAEDRIYAFSIKDHKKVWEYQTINDILFGFCVNEDKLVCPVDDTLFCLDVRTGKQVWKTFYPNSNATNPPSYFDSYVYAAFDQFLYCVDINTGNLVWQFEAGYFVESAPAVSDEYIWIGADDFLLYCLDRKTGNKLYFALVGSTSKYIVIDKNRIYSLSVYGELFSFLHDAMKRRSYVEFEMWVGRNYVRDNGKTYTIDAPPFIQDGRTMVPIRPIGDALGAEVIWYPNDKRIAYSLKTQFVQMKVNDSIAYVNGKSFTMSVPPVISNDRAFVPLRFVGEKLGAKIQWNANEKKVTINYP